MVNYMVNIFAKHNIFMKSRVFHSFTLYDFDILIVITYLIQFVLL